MDYQRNDAMLMEILQDRKHITGFLDSIFGFLRRNTDFYHTKKDDFDPMGFPAGMRDQLIYAAMQQYEEPVSCAVEQEQQDYHNGDMVPPAVEEIILETEPKTEPKNANFCQFTASDYKNGAAFDLHCWAQTLKDVEVQVKLPQELQAAKQLNIEIGSQLIKISSKSKPEMVILEGKLSQSIRHKEVVWSIDQGRLLISCDKTKEVWWERLFEEDAAIDVTQLDCERYIDELPEDSQLAIEKLRIQQADMSHETLERLKAAWNVEGSPFKGQPFDPSLVRMS